MSTDLILLVSIITLSVFSVLKRVTIQTVLLVLLASFTLGISFGPDLADLLARQGDFFETRNVALALYLLLIFGPTCFAYWHFRGGARYSLIERLIVSVFFSLMSIVVITNIFSIANYDDPFRNSYFANQLNRFDGFITLLAFMVAFFEVVSQSSPGVIQAKKNRLKKKTKK